MDTPKYHIGQIVYFAAPAVKRGAPSGAHRVERLLPPENDQHQYRLKAVDTGRERVAREDQISGRMTVEALAQRLYEAGNTTNVPWARRDRTVRDPWLREALAHLSRESDDI
ncbi:hypothetical protein [Azospirillum sp. TSO22-1]|uniref:hypothetical protein n=1 Tax=Azospirillum sp. TSO22-1 TaxID=716789 RepID=UPI0018EE6914|nr:hypothetical protein [Azospirillum sp. TSO22-1]